jgi:hypothetical protein
MNAVFPRGQGKSPKVRAFVDFLIERVKFDADYMETLCPNHKCCEGELEIAQAMASLGVDPVGQSASSTLVEA